MNLQQLKMEWFSNVRADVLAGITVALALIPEAIAFSIIAGVDPMVGLYAVLTGILQLVLGASKISKLMTFVPHTIVLGFVNALAILIFMAQLPHFIGASWVMYVMLAGTLAIIYLLPRLTKAVPSALVAIIVMTVISIWAGLDVRTVGDMGSHVWDLSAVTAISKVVEKYRQLDKFVVITGLNDESKRLIDRVGGISTPAGH